MSSFDISTTTGVWLKRAVLTVYLKDIATYLLTDCDQFSLSGITSVQGM